MLSTETITAYDNVATITDSLEEHFEATENVKYLDLPVTEEAISTLGAASDAADLLVEYAIELRDRLDEDYKVVAAHVYAL